MNFKVGSLIEMLALLPPETRVYTAGTEGIADLETGNQSPFKVKETPFGAALFIDDGAGVHDGMDQWVPLDEFVSTIRGLIL